MKSFRLPKPFYGYYIVASCFLTLFMLWGMFVNSFGIFFKPITEDLDCSRAALATALFIRSIGIGLAAPFAGRMIDRFGAKPVMAAGTLAVGLGFLASSRATELWQLSVIFFVAGCGLTCATMIPTSLILSNWFVSRRGTAMSSAFVGTGAGGVVMAPVANWIILNYSWRVAFALCGAVIVLAVVPVILFVMRDRPSEIGLEPYKDADAAAESTDDDWGVGAREALSLRAFWLIAAIMFIVALIANGVHNHCVAFLTDIGHSPTKAAVVWSAVMGVLVFGKLAFGPIADRWGARSAMTGTFIMLSVSIVVLMFARPYWLAMVFAALYGFACGGPLTLYPLLTVGSLGLKNFGSIYGNLMIVAAVGSAIGPLAPGMAFSYMGSYLPVFSAFAVLSLVGAVCAISITPASRRPPAAAQALPADAWE